MRYRTRSTFQWWACAVLLAAAARAADQSEIKSLVQRAFDLHQKGQYSQALPLLRQAYRVGPTDYFVNLLLGIDTLRTGDPKAAVPFLKKASRLRPHEEFPLAYLGEAYACEGLYGDAAEAYLRATSVAPTSADSSIALVDFSLSRFATMSTALRSTKKGLSAEYRLRARALPEGDSARVALLQHAADLDPELPGIWSELAGAEFDAADTAAAEANLHRALQADKSDLEGWLVDARLGAASGDWRRASERLNAVAEHSPGVLARELARWPKRLQPPAGAASGVAAAFLTCVRDHKTTCNLPAGGARKVDGSLLFREQRWEQLVSLPPPQPSASPAWLQRGTALAQLDDCHRAIPALERGLSGKLSDNYAMFLLSWCYSQEAGRVAEEVQRSATDDAPLHIMRGDIFLRLRAKAEAAVSEYQLALARDPGDPSVLERLAEAQFGAGQDDAARSSAQAALALDQQRLGPKRTLAKIAMQRRDYATALPFLRELAARNPEDVSSRIELAKACAQTGALQDARDSLAPALDHGFPDERGTLHYLLGTVLRKMGHNTEAEQAFGAAAQLSEAFQHKSYRDQDHDPDAEAER